jgi:hypothetical protein
MTNLPKWVEDYFNGRGKDIKKLEDIPETKAAFEKMTKQDQDASAMLNKLGKALEKDFADGKFVGGGDDEVEPDDKVRTYLYAIH